MYGLGWVKVALEAGAWCQAKRVGGRWGGGSGESRDLDGREGYGWRARRHLWTRLSPYFQAANSPPLIGR